MTKEEIIIECSERYGISGDEATAIYMSKEKTRRFDFENFIAELEAYRVRPSNLKHDLLVPQAYINEETGYKLGLEVGRVRCQRVSITEEQKAKLCEMGFVFDAKSFDFEKFKQELLKFKELHSTQEHELWVPTSYVNKENGYKLGQRFTGVRCSKIKTSDAQKSELSELGFAWEVKKLERFDFGVFMSELNAYKNLPSNKKHDLLVPKTYVNQDSGYRLGKMVNRVRIGDIHTTKGQQSKLNEIGFVWSVAENKFDFDTFADELRIYKELFNDLLVPVMYVNKKSGYKLGFNVKCVRSGNIEMSEEQYSTLDKMGFVWETKKFDFDIFKSELLKYKNDPSNIKHDLLVPQAYADEETGYKLGRTVGSVRSGNVRTDELQKQELDEIGFVWDVIEYNRNINDSSSKSDSQMGDE